jgi:hypothetical protein
MGSKQQHATTEIAVRYDKTEITYTTEFLASPGREELVLDFSSGLIAETQNDQVKSLPIHTRLALPWSAVERLTEVLNQVVERRKQLAGASAPARDTTAGKPTLPRASLPRMGSEQVS